MAIKVNISVSDGPDKGSAHEFSNGELTVGRSNAGYVVNDKKISGNHCKFIIDENELWLEDLESTNGTFLNGKKLSGRDRVQNLDEIVIGLSKLSIAIVEELEEFKKVNLPEADDGEEILDLTEEVKEDESTKRTEAEQAPKGHPKYGESGVFRIDEVIKDEVNTFSKWDHPAGPKTAPTETKGLAKIQVHLIIKQGPEGIDKLICTKPVTTLGRKNVDLKVSDVDCSRKHSQIEIKDDNTAYIKDLASTNGTFVNGVRINNQQLHDGDLIQIGRTIFEVSLQAPEA